MPAIRSICRRRPFLMGMPWLLVVIAAGTCLCAPAAALRVVVTTPDLASIARSIGGERVELHTLVRPTEDAHFIDAKPSFIVKLNAADALIEGGAELEAGWLSPLLQGARNPRLNPGMPGRIPANTGVTMLEVPATLDRSRGDLHASGNPHYLAGPGNAAIVATNIAEAFCRLDPPGASVYREALASFASALELRRRTWKATLAPFGGRHFVAYHDSWIYFAAEFGLRTEYFMEPKPGIPPSASHLEHLIDSMKRHGIQVLFVEPHLSRKTPDLLASRTGARVVPVTQFPGGLKGTEAGYLEMMDRLVADVAAAMK